MQRGLEYQPPKTSKPPATPSTRNHLKPDYAEAWNRRAVLFFNEGKYDEAIADLETAISTRSAISAPGSASQ
jgi:tetratricopeptide (TPR) repeat protein